MQQGDVSQRTGVMPSRSSSRSAGGGRPALPATRRSSSASGATLATLSSAPVAELRGRSAAMICAPLEAINQASRWTDPVSVEAVTTGRRTTPPGPSHLPPPRWMMDEQTSGRPGATIRWRNMPLASGTRLGPYEILAAIGAGDPATVRGWIVPRELRRGLARLRLDAASARPRRSSAGVEPERRRAEAQRRTRW